MSDSTEDLKNIDSYGVWVKRPPQDAERITEDAAADPAINAEEVSIEEPVIPEDLSFDTLTDNDSTLSEEEVSSLKSDISEPETKSDGADDFFKDELPDFSDLGTTEPAETEAENSGESEISLDDFIGAEGFDDPNKAFEPKTENAEKSEEKPTEQAAQEEPADASSFEDGELSLDDFMDGGFSDSGSGAPAGNSGSDEISLDDFFDDDTSSTKEDDVSNDEPLDIDLSFTENPDDKVPTEETDISADDEDSNAFAEDDMFDNISAENSAENETKTSENPVAQDLDATTEEVSLDDFGIDENSDDATAVAAGASVNSQADSEEVDLSDFGIDSDAGETPVKQDVHASKKKVVDYDIAITDDDSVQEAPKAEEVVTSEPKETSEENKNSVKVDSSMLDMIMQELSGLKNQINSLRDEFQTIKESKNEIQPEQKTEEHAEETQEIPEATIPAENSEQENTGFFDGNDNDETIALSGDELSNIMNTADITESTEETPEQESEELPEEISEATIPEADEIAENTEDFGEGPQVETEESEGNAETEESPLAEETEKEETVEPAKEISEPETIPEETEISEPADSGTEKTEENPENFNDDSPFGTIDETNSLEEEPDSGLSMNSDEEKLEEPNLDEINMKNMEEEISIPKVDDLADDIDTPLDDILVESSNSDLINSVDEKEVPAPEMPEEAVKEAESVEPAEEIAEPEEIPSTETENSEEAENPSEEENKIYEDFIAEDPKVSESISAENIDYLNEDKSDSNDAEKTEEIEAAEEIPEAEPEIAPESEEPELAETVEPEETDSTEEIPSEIETDNNKQLPDDLKNDVKSVLLYMDQLLENLPEDKIMEFAKSEQFTTYKKLFSELGLAK